MPAKSDPHEAWVLANATHFTACVFRGRGQYDTTEHPSLDAAREHAKTIDTDRGVMLYAVFGIHQGHIETVQPTKKSENRMIYVITYRNYLEDLRIRTAVSKAASTLFLNSQSDPAMSARAVGEPLDITGSKKFMTDLYNILAREGDEKVSASGFNTRATGQDRIFERLSRYYGSIPAMLTEEPAASPDEAQPPATAHEESTDMATKAKVKKTKKKATGEKSPRVKNTDNLDVFGLRKGSKASEAAALFARAKGSEMTEVAEKCGGSKYNLLNQLKEEGHKVKKDGKTFFLTAK